LLHRLLLYFRRGRERIKPEQNRQPTRSNLLSRNLNELKLRSLLRATALLSIFHEALEQSAMRKLSSIALVGTLAVLMGGCDALSFLPWVGTEDETAVIEDAQTPQPGESPTAQVPQAEFAEPVEPGAAVPAAPAQGLIPATDPNQRLQDIKQSRPDPFSAIPTTPLSVPTPDVDANNPGGGAGGGAGGTGTGTGAPETPGRAIQEVPPLPIIPQPPQIVQAPPVGRPGNGGGTAGGGGANGDPIAIGPNFIPDLPSVPQPTLAEGVAVTGVIQVNGVPHAIVEAPGQQSRYVKQGDYLANGQVLVKRIEASRGRTPVVILEQAGIEVAKRVGEGGAPTAMEGSESASLAVNHTPRS
jgi:hypothetical protein